MKNKKVKKSFKIKKKIIFIFLILVFFILYFCLRSKNYQVEYIVNDIKVVENYNKKEKTYNFFLYKGEKEFYFALPHSYIHHKKLLEAIEVKEKEATLCLLPKSKELEVYPVCMQNNVFVSYHIIEDPEIIDPVYKKEISYEEKKFHNLNLYALNDKKFYIWNYEGFYVISENTQKEIKLFQEDAYNIPLTIKVGPYLLMANYDEKYAFHKFYVLHTKKDKVHELKLEKEISFDSYFLGTTNKKAYLVDRKNKMEYEIYPKRLLIESVANNNQGKILVKDVWEPISLNKLVNADNSFTHHTVTQFVLEDSVLYKLQGNIKTKISNQSIKEIVSTTEDTVYYLVEDRLYSYHDGDGEVLVLSNFEWNFNYKNMIYVF